LSVGASTVAVGPGHRLFAKYAHAPNNLGYCGPDGVQAIRESATGERSVDLTDVARRFSGAWPYQSTAAELAGIDDPMDARVVRSYWTGNDVTDALNPREFGEALFERIKPQAAHYWAHLDETLLDEAAPTHAFHVLSVYPWTRLLPSGRPEPLFVLDSCRITWATVEDVDGEDLVVTRQPLEHVDGALRLGDPSRTRVSWRKSGQQFIEEPTAGDVVAVHWGNVCDVLTPDEADTLERWTHWQLDAISPRLESAAR
jgi:hypothetical protein